ncbi:MAG TPA: hypothetical protein VHZ95_16920, partial [Polyangiales bacterium]|nr:hypothetical protein [Polyangiales bacterium]
MPLLQQCAAVPDAPPLTAAALDALRTLGGIALAKTADAIGSARSIAESRALAARALRELIQALPPEPEPEPSRSTSRDRRARSEARVARAQSRALVAHRAAPSRPTLQPVETLPGVGPNLGQALRARGVATIGDLIWLLPSGYDDERTVTPLKDLQYGVRQVTEGTVISARAIGSARGRMAEVWLGSDAASGGELRLTWFRAPPGLLARFVAGMRYRVAGVVEEFRGHQQITHPDTQRLESEEPAAIGGIVPRYVNVPGVAPRKLKSFTRLAIQRAVHDVDEAVP